MESPYSKPQPKQEPMKPQTLIELTYLIGWKFDERIWKLEKSVEEFCFMMLSEVKRGKGYNEESVDMMFWNEPTSFSFVDELVKEVRQWVLTEHTTPYKQEQENKSFKDDQSKKPPKQSGISLPNEINILKESDINLKANSTTKNHPSW